MDVSVIIVSYNVKYFLEQCLYALQQSLVNIQGEVFVVDNNSSDNSIAYLSAKFSNVHFIQNKQNAGFGKACNQPLSVAKGKYILFLNPDTIVAEDTIQNCIHFFDEHTNAGAIGCKMIDGSGHFLPESKRSFPSVSASFYKLSGISSLFPASEKFNQYALGYLDENKDHEVDVLCGAFMMVKKEVLDQTGGFDEAFFMYGEDIDLCYRIKQLGYKIYYTASTTIVHFKGESSKQNKAKHLNAFYDAMRIFVNKHYTTNYTGLLSFLLKTAIVVRALVSALLLPYYAVKKSFTKKITSALLVNAQSVSQTRIKEIQSHYADIKFLSSQQLQSVQNAAIIFCIDDLFTYKQAIEQLQSSQKNASCKWHAVKSDSIVGSDNKNDYGETLFLQNR